MSEIFVAGDIHGNYQGLMESLNAAGWQEGDTIICVGDVTDRGKDNITVTTWMSYDLDTIRRSISLDTSRIPKL